MNAKISLIFTSFKKETSILSPIAKKLQARQFLPNCLSEKASESKEIKIKILVILQHKISFVKSFPFSK